MGRKQSEWEAVRGWTGPVHGPPACAAVMYVGDILQTKGSGILPCSPRQHRVSVKILSVIV